MVFGRQLGHEGASSWVGSAPSQKGPQGAPPPFRPVRTQEKTPARTKRESSPRSKSGVPWSWSFRPPELRQIHVRCLRHSPYGVLSQQYKQIKPTPPPTGNLSSCPFYCKGFCGYFFVFVSSVSNMLGWPSKTERNKHLWLSIIKMCAWHMQIF